MRYAVCEQRLACPVEQAWELVLDTTRWTSWVESLSSLAWTGAARWEVGARLQLEWTGDVRSVSEITALRRHQLIAVETRSRGRLSFDRVVFAPVAAGTQLEWVSEISRGGLAELLDTPTTLFGERRLPSSFERHVARRLRSLAHHVEHSLARPYR